MRPSSFVFRVAISLALLTCLELPQAALAANKKELDRPCKTFLELLGSNKISFYPKWEATSALFNPMGRVFFVQRALSELGTLRETLLKMEEDPEQIDIVSLSSIEPPSFFDGSPYYHLSIVAVYGDAENISELRKLLDEPFQTSFDAQKEFKDQIQRVIKIIEKRIRPNKSDRSSNP